MAKIGIKKIMIAKRGNVSESFFDTSGLMPKPFHQFNEIEFVQNSASLTDEIIDDENGTYHIINLDFSTRKDLDHWKNYINSFIEIPVIILVVSVDGNNYVIGSNKAPAYITVNNKYQRIDSRELYTTCTYKNKNGLLTVKHDPSLTVKPGESSPEQIEIDTPIVRVPWQGGIGTISVSSTSQNWNTQTLNKQNYANS